MKSLSDARHPYGMAALAVLLVAAAAAWIIFLHTVAPPEKFVEALDTFTPGGPQFLFNDITPTDRTNVISLFDGAVTRPVKTSPVYLLFQPRVHSEKIIVELTAQADISGTPEIQMGHRTCADVKCNVLTRVHDDTETSEWHTWHVEIPFDKMLRENYDARRLVFSFPHQNGEVWYIKSVHIRYE